MSALLRLLAAVLMAGLFISGFFYFVASLLGSLAFNPASKAWKELVAKLRARLEPPKPPRKSKLPEVLTPFNTEALTHLSLKPAFTKKTGWFDHTFEGVFNTIYREPIMVFAGQKSGKNTVVVAKTTDHEFIFQQKAKETHIWMDGVPVAVWIDGNLLTAGKQGKLLAKMTLDSELRQWPVIIGQSEGATLTNGELAISPIPRAVTLLRNLSKVEEETLLVLAVLQGMKQGR